MIIKFNLHQSPATWEGGKYSISFAPQQEEGLESLTDVMEAPSGKAGRVIIQGSIMLPSNAVSWIFII